MTPVGNLCSWAQSFSQLAVNISMLDDASREQDDEQLVLLLPEMFEIEEAKEDDQPEEPAYVRTKPSDAAGEVPDDTRLESDNNTVAASDLLPDEKGKDDINAEDRVKILRLIENMTLGRNAVAYLTESMHGAGSPQAQRVQIRRRFDIEEKKDFAKKLSGVKERD